MAAAMPVPRGALVPARALTATAVAVCVLGLAVWAWPSAPVPGRVVLSIVGTADLHGRLDPDAEGRGGLALFGGYLANLRATRAADGGVVLLDAGDTFQGGLDSSFSEGAVVVDAYNALGYTALAIGNHDFEFGAEDRDGVGEAGRDLRGALKARAAQARFPFLAANLVDDATGRPVNWPNVRPSTTTTVAGVRVGIVGVMTRPALSMTLAANVGGLTVSPLGEAIAREATALRAAGTQVVIVVAHAGGHCEALDDPDALATCDANAEMFEVLRGLPAGLVDAVAGGHTHSAVAHRVHGVPVVQAYYWGQAFSRVDLTVDTASGRVVESRIFPPTWICGRQAGGEGRCAAAASAAASAVPVYEGRPVAPDAKVSAAMAPALQRIGTLRARPVGVALDGPIPRGDRDGESPLGHLFADAMRASVPGADAALGYSAGPGGLRAGLSAGPVTLGAVYDLFPFDNRVVRVDVTGADLRRLLTDQVRRPRFRSRSLGVSGLVVTMTCGAGGMQADVRRASGAPIADAERLVIATTDFMAARFAVDGADPEAGRARPVGGTYQSAPLLREVVRGWLRDQRPTLTAARFADPSRPRWVVNPSAMGGCSAPAL